MPATATLCDVTVETVSTFSTVDTACTEESGLICPRTMSHEGLLCLYWFSLSQLFLVHFIGCLFGHFNNMLGYDERRREEHSPDHSLIDWRKWIMAGHWVVWEMADVVMKSRRMKIALPRERRDLSGPQCHTFSFNSLWYLLAVVPSPFTSPRSPQTQVPHPPSFSPGPP